MALAISHDARPHAEVLDLEGDLAEDLADLLVGKGLEECDCEVHLLSLSLDPLYLGPLRRKVKRKKERMFAFWIKGLSPLLFSSLGSLLPLSRSSKIVEQSQGLENASH